MVNKNITIVLFVFNEEKRIRYFLEATKNFCSIVVIDNFSEDNTVEIAKEYTDHVVQYKNPGYVEHPDCVENALSFVDTEWVFWARADEIPPLPLLKKLDEIVCSDACDAVLIPRLNILFGFPTKTWGDDYQIAFFKKSYLDYSQNALYELTILPDARKLKLSPKKSVSLWHFSSYDITAYTNTNNRYSTITAEMVIRQRELPKVQYSNSNEPIKVVVKKIVGKFQLSRRLTLLRLLINPSFRFLWHYIIRGGFLSGMVGFTTSVLMMMEQMLVELKIFELENRVSLEKIESYYTNLKTILIAGEIPDFESDPFAEK